MRWGIIGAGDVAEVKSGPGFQRASESELVAVMRRNGEKARDFARRHGVPRWYDDASALLADAEIDAVYIATPPVYHLDYVIAVLGAGKHVYVEKPMAMDAAECRTMIEADEASDRKVSVAHYRRRLPAFLKVDQLLREGRVGALRLAEVRILHPGHNDAGSTGKIPWRLLPEISGGGLFHDLAPHHLDLMRLYFGDPVRWAGFSMNQAAASEADDCVCGHVEFPDGILFHGVWNFAIPADYAEQVCVITGETGRIRFGFDGHEVKLENQDGIQVFTFELPDAIQQPMIERVNAYFRGEAENPCSTTDGLRVLELIDAFTSKDRSDWNSTPR